MQMQPKPHLCISLDLENVYFSVMKKAVRQMEDGTRTGLLS